MEKQANNTTIEIEAPEATWNNRTLEDAMGFRAIRESMVGGILDLNEVDNLDDLFN